MTAKNEEKTEIKERKKKSKRNRKKLVSDACPLTPVLPYNSIGRIISTKQGHLFNCVNCLCITPLSKESYDGGYSPYPTCGCLSLNQDNLENDWSCGICNRIIQKPKLFDYMEIKELKFGKQKKIPNNQVYAEYLIYNDELPNNKKKLQNIKLCVHHTFTWITKFERILKLSEIRNALLNNLHSSIIDGERMFMENKYKKWSSNNVYPNLKKNESS